MDREIAFAPLEKMPPIAGLVVPGDGYWILVRPAPLLGMIRPSAGTPWNALCDAGVRCVVCLTDDVPPYDPAPLTVAHSVGLQDLYGGITPSDPPGEKRRIDLAADAVVAALRRGEGVVVHCAGGTGRTGTVLGATLIRLGIPPADAVARIQAASKLRGRHWPESPWQQDVLLRP